MVVQDDAFCGHVWWRHHTRVHLWEEAGRSGSRASREISPTSNVWFLLMSF